jgi:RNA polymerase sigma-70 factor, ECF subfamily
MTGDKQTAADLGQEVFLKAYRHMDSFRGDSKFTTWLYSIARNHCSNARVARQARREETVEPFLLDMTSEKGPGPEARLERQEREDSLRSLIRESLDPLEAQVMSLHYGEELRLDSISRLLGLTNASGAKAYIVSARRKLTRAISASKSFPKGRRKAPQP